MFASPKSRSTKMNIDASRVNRRWSRPSQVCAHLFVGGALALDPRLIADKDITCIINATNEVPTVFVPGVESFKLWLNDTAESDITMHLDTIADHINMVAQDGGRVLIHCVAGISRSPSLVMGYLMKYNHMSLRDAYYHLSRVRPMVRPNMGFWKQLMAYEKSLFNRNTVHMAHIPGSDQTVPDVYLVNVHESIEEEPEAEAEAAAAHGHQSRVDSCTSLDDLLEEGGEDGYGSSKSMSIATDDDYGSSLDDAGSSIGTPSCSSMSSRISSRTASVCLETASESSSASSP